MDKRNKIIKWIYAIGVLGLLLLFFISICPIVMFDTDDYFNTYHMRRAVPIWGEWNPSKVFPEVLMPFLGLIAGKIVTPLLGDYFTSMSVVFGCAVAVSITIYVLCFNRYITKKFELDLAQSLFLSTLFFLFHFWAMRTVVVGNPYLFRAYNATCYFNYTVPTLLNSSIVMLLESGVDKILLNKDRNVVKGIFLLAVYMAIFSNLYSSHVLAIYCGVRFLRTGLQKVKKEIDTRDFVRDIILDLSIILSWIISAVYELSGGRASSMEERNLRNAISYSAKLFAQLPQKLNSKFLDFVIGIILMALICVLVTKNGKAQRKKFFQNVILASSCVLLVSVYLVLLSAVTSSGYLEYECVLLSLSFYVFLLVFAHISVLIKCLPQLITVVPILVVLIYCNINTNGNTFKPSNVSLLPAETCQQINRIFLQQVWDAEKNNLEHMCLYVPDWENGTNWPHSGPPRIVENFYYNGVIPYLIEVESVVDPDFETRYGISIN